MIEVPKHFNPVSARDIREAQRLAKTIGWDCFDLENTDGR